MRASEETAVPLDLDDLTLPIAVRPATPPSDEELMRFSERNKPYRIERNKEGEIIIMTPVGGIGGNHEFLILAAFTRWMDAGMGGMMFGPNTGFNLPDGSCLSPDGAWVAGSRWNAFSAEEQEGYPPLCPDFLIAVRFKSDRRRPLEEKMRLWMENGAKLAWLIDPVEATVTIYRQNAAEQTLDRPDAVSADPPAEGFLLKTSTFWLRG
jgi:Uma2 family endonuclease